MSNEFVLVSDIHGNYPSLKQVVEREGAGAEYIVLGDLMGLNGYPKETLDLLNEMEPRILLVGNHDKALFHHNEGHVNSDKLSEFELAHTKAALTPAQQGWLSNLPFMHVLTRGGQRICATHAYPWPEKASGYEQGNAGVSKANVTHVASVVSDDYDWVWHGHTHTQYDLDCSKFGHDVHFVNPGSLGYDGTYSVVDTDSGSVEHRSTEWDHEALKQHVESLLPEGAPHVENWL